MPHNREIYLELRDKIIFGEFHPGELLSESRLAELFECSRVPIRDALIRLESEGLVKIVPKKGTYVSQISLDDLRENFAVRKHLNKLVGRMAAKNATEEQVEKMGNILSETAHTNDYRRLLELDYAFHRTVHEATGNSTLSMVMKILLTQAVRVWLFSFDKSSTNIMIPGNLEDIKDSIEDGDQKKTAELLSEHVQVAIDSIGDSILKSIVEW